MPPRDPGIWMWAEACEFLDRAERLHRQFFQPRRPGSTQRPTWQPPVDLFETEAGYLIVIALPGVRPEQMEAVIDRGVLSVVGERSLPIGKQAGLIHRFEIPHGRFERHIELPPGPLEITRRELIDGCLYLGLRKLG